MILILCPKCGSENIIVEGCNEYNIHGDYYECKDCSKEFSHKDAEILEKD